MRTFFVSCMGRSGSQWLAALLDESPNSRVKHEWWSNRYRDMTLLHECAVGLRIMSEIYWMADLRVQATEKAARKCGKAIYGEVNPQIAYYLPHLARLNPGVVLALVRDGRDVVRSNHARRLYQPNDLRRPFLPGPDDPLRPNWDQLNRFQKLCWLWAQLTGYVDRQAHTFIRFEDLLSDNGFNILVEKLLMPMGMELDYEDWDEHRDRRIGGSPGFRMPRWPEWTDEQTEWFWELCGPLMDKYGYER